MESGGEDADDEIEEVLEEGGDALKDGEDGGEDRVDEGTDGVGEGGHCCGLGFLEGSSSGSWSVEDLEEEDLRR